jgi:hypothetical protein
MSTFDNQVPQLQRPHLGWSKKCEERQKAKEAMRGWRRPEQPRVPNTRNHSKELAPEVGEARATILEAEGAERQKGMSPRRLPQLRKKTW